MILTVQQSLIVIILIAFITFLTRVIPFVLFPANKETPKYIVHLVLVVVQYFICYLFSLYLFELAYIVRILFSVIHNVFIKGVAVNVIRDSLAYLRYSKKQISLKNLQCII